YPGDLATVTVTVAAKPAGQTPTPVPPSGHAPVRVRVPAPSRPAVVAPAAPNRPLAPAGTTRLPLLVVKAKQKGAAVKGLVNVPDDGSRLDARLTIKGKGRKAKRVVVGKAVARKLPAGPYALTVKLDKRHGRAALRGHRSLKGTLA